jgi:hypothetical protein
MQGHKLTSSQAHKLTSSQAHKLFSVLPLMLVTGCIDPDSSTSRFSDPGREVSSHSITAYAGIVLADRDGYLCLPFSQVGLSAEADEVVSLTSSCDCVRPKVISYLTPNGDSAKGIFLEYIREQYNKNEVAKVGLAGSRAIDLSVVIGASLKSGSAIEFRVNLLHTTGVAVDMN